MTADMARCKPSLSASQSGFGLYVHWPFCQAKCPYCDFNSHVRASIDQDRWCRAMLAELQHMAEGYPQHGQLKSIFFGGGTPSLMVPRVVGAIIDRAARLFDCCTEIEVTLEANPTSVESGNFQGYAQAGVNRVSLGVQSLDDAALKFLGREHSVHEAIHAIEIAQRWFQRSSFDLIYARAGQTETGWINELDQAIGLAANHISLYQLTIEPGTRFHALKHAGQLPVMDDDTQARLYEVTVERLNRSGLCAYEVSNFARAGDESRHNLGYWRYNDYVGVGPGAHGRLTIERQKFATQTARSPDQWLNNVERDGHAELSRQPLSRADMVAETIMMGLRLSEGVEYSRLERLAGPGWRDLIDIEAVGLLNMQGLLETDEFAMRATGAGRLVLDSVLAKILI